MHIWRQRQSVDHRWLCFNFKETGKQFYQSSIEMQDFSTADMIFDGFFFVTISIIIKIRFYCIDYRPYIIF